MEKDKNQGRHLYLTGNARPGILKRRVRLHLSFCHGNPRHLYEGKDTLWDETKRLANPHTVYVDLSDRLYQIKSELLEQMGREALSL